LNELPTKALRSGGALTPPIFSPNLSEYWRPRLTLDCVYDAMRSVPDDIDAGHYLAASGKDVLKRVTLADDDGQVVVQV
jgi:hypothetical protein